MIWDELSRNLFSGQNKRKRFITLTSFSHNLPILNKIANHSAKKAYFFYQVTDSHCRKNSKITSSKIFDSFS